jgi:hypothetical protein
MNFVLHISKDVDLWIRKSVANSTTTTYREMMVVVVTVITYRDLMIFDTNSPINILSEGEINFFSSYDIDLLLLMLEGTPGCVFTL